MNLNLALKTVGASMKVGGKFVVKHLPTILTAVGTIGVVAGTVLAAKKAPDAHADLQAIKDNWDALSDEERADRGKASYIWKLVKVGTKYYGIVALVVGGSVICFWVANHLNLKRLAAALAAGKLSADYAKDLENQIKKEGGDGKLEEMKDSINAEKIQEKDIPFDVSRLNTLIGECPVWDPIVKHWTISSADKINKAIEFAANDLVEQIESGSDYAFYPYSDFFETYGGFIEEPDIQDDSYSYEDASSHLGFALNPPMDFDKKRLREAAMRAIGVSWTAALKNGDIPVLALKYQNPPKYSIWEG